MTVKYLVLRRGFRDDIMVVWMGYDINTSLIPTGFYRISPFFFYHF